MVPSGLAVHQPCLSQARSCSLPLWSVRALCGEETVPCPVVCLVHQHGCDPPAEATSTLFPCSFQHVIRGNRPIKTEMAHQLYALQVLTFNLLEERMMTKMDPNDQVGSRWDRALPAGGVCPRCALSLEHLLGARSRASLCLQKWFCQLCASPRSLPAGGSGPSPSVSCVMPPQGLIRARVLPGKA